MLHLSKLAYGCDSLSDLFTVASQRAVDGRIFMTTRYMPKRHAEILGGGSLYWIIRHQLLARAAILEFADNGAGRINIMLDAAIVRVEPYPRRAHQGWRYLENADAPPDLESGGAGLGSLPGELTGELAALGLI